VSAERSGSARRALGRVAQVPKRMLSGSRLDVRSAAVRVALVATAIVFVAYVVIAAAVVLIVNRNLTTDIDGRLQSRLSLYVGELSGQPMQPGANGFSGPSQHSLQEPLLTWIIFPGGAVRAYVDNDTQFRPQGTLPDSARSITSSSTFALSDGTEIRGAGVAIAGGHIIVGQSVANVEATQHNILTAELLIGPLLLVLVFLGAYTVGRRVGSPIERARQRQIEMTADASHELRTPLSVIEAQTSLALERERDVDWYRNAFQAVGIESKRMRRLVDDLLWLARFDSAGPAPTSEATDLGVLAEQAAERFTAVAEARGLTLNVTVEPVSTMISAPPEWLDRLLGVLLDNACRYTPPGGSVEVQVGRSDGRVRLAVDDSGPGIPAKERGHIFDRFRRASDAPGGSGLGLAIAAAVVSASGGRWEVGVAPAGGASMAVSWTPLIRGGAETEGSARNQAASTGDDRSPGGAGALAPPPPPHPA
jgi:signal transduction histidine kinase